MNKLLAVLLTFLTLALTSSAWAFQVPAQPEKCPEVTSIQQTAFLAAKLLSDGQYGAIQISAYDTNEVWGFLVYKINAASIREALDKAKTALNSLTYASGPTYFPQNKVWGCIYNIDSGYQAVALTPLPTAAVNTESVFKKLFT